MWVCYGVFVCALRVCVYERLSVHGLHCLLFLCVRMCALQVGVFAFVIVCLVVRCWFVCDVEYLCVYVVGWVCAWMRV